MTKIVQIAATVEETPLTVDVTGAPGSAGVAVSHTAKSSSVTLSNTSRGCDMQYKVGSGSWVDLERGCGIDLPIDFSATSLYLRRSTLDGGPATASLNVEGLPTLSVSNTTVPTKADGVPVPVGASFTLTAEDDDTVFACTADLTITIPAGLTPRPSIAAIPPASGNVTIVVTGGAQANGGTSPVVRSRASNPAGVAVVPYVDADGYGVSGS